MVTSLQTSDTLLTIFSISVVIFQYDCSLSIQGGETIPCDSDNQSHTQNTDKQITNDLFCMDT